MSSIFTKIIRGEIPCYKIAENKHCFAFLDIRPNTPGHTLVVPKKEVDKITDLDEDSYRELMAFSHKIARALDRSMDAKRVAMAVVGLEVPHVHVHLIPIDKMSDMDFSHSIDMTPGQFESIARRIRNELE